MKNKFRYTVRFQDFTAMIIKTVHCLQKDGDRLLVQNQESKNSFTCIGEILFGKNAHIIWWEMIVFLINDPERIGCINGKKSIDFFLMPYMEIKIIKNGL